MLEKHNDLSQAEPSSDPVTAVDYLENQLELEKEAKELMPYDPNSCTFLLGAIRQQVFACLTCAEENGNQPSGVCYSCSIQCHSTHDIVELFTKRSFTCDCGTTRMKKSGACKIRTRTTRRDSVISRSVHDESLTVGEDISSSSNEYNQNFKGLFCSCSKEYDPLEETGNMIQCILGYNCGEDWYHDECIMGFEVGSLKRKNVTKINDNIQGVNILDQLPPAGLDAHTETINKSNQIAKVKDESGDEEAQENNDADNDTISVPGFPDLNDFDTFVCWKCVAPFEEQFNQLPNNIVLTKLPYVECSSVEERKKKLGKYIDGLDERATKKRKTSTTNKFSVFLKDNYKENLRTLKEETKDKDLQDFLEKFPYLYEADPIYEPAEDDEDDMSSIFDLGTKALNSLPREQAIEGLQAYEQIKEKLRGFLKPFAEEGKVVTETEIRDFFKKATEERFQF